MNNHSSSIEAPKEQHSGSSLPSSNSTWNLSSKKSKWSMLESSQKEIGTILSPLPNDIVLDIFSRLSVKDLKNCIQVRKSWCKMVFSLTFSKLYFEKSANGSANMVSFIVQDECAFDDSAEYDLYLVQCESANDSLSGKSTVLPLRTKLMDMNIEYELVGSCQGLLCLSKPPFGDPVYICNPVIGEYMTLPFTAPDVDIDLISGFGYDATTSVCKVIRMIYEPMKVPDNDATPNLVAEVYELGAKNWRNIGSVPFRPSADCPGVFSNGCIFWLCEPEFCNDESCGIVCLDLSSEQFRLLALPPGYPRDVLLSIENGRKFEVMDIKGHLYFYDERSADAVVWMLNDNGEVQSWTEVLKLDELFHKFDVLKAIRGLPLMNKPFNHVTSLISYMDKNANEDSKGLACYDKAEMWSTNLCITPGSDLKSQTSPSVISGGSITAEEPLEYNAPLQCLALFNPLSYYYRSLANKHLQFSYVQNPSSSNPDDYAIRAAIWDDENNPDREQAMDLHEFYYAHLKMLSKK